jgi:ADP-heptose:LPS heptosyltransferase
MPDMNESAATVAAATRRSFTREISPAQGLAAVVEWLRTFRRRAAPPGSRRESLARLIYAPILSVIPGNPFRSYEKLRSIEAELVTIQDVGVVSAVRAPIRRLIVLKLDHIGDLIVGMRAIRTLRDGFPDAHITLVCASWNRVFAERLGVFDRVLCFDFFTPLNRDWTATAKDLAALYDRFAELPLQSYDLAIDLRHDPDTRPCLYRVDARYRAGFYATAEAGLPYMDLMLPISEAMRTDDGRQHSLHADLRLQVMAAAAVASFAPEPPHPALALLQPDSAASRRAAAPRSFAVFAVGAGDPIRVWPVERYAAVGNALIARHGLEIVIVGGPSDTREVTELAALLPAGHARTVVGQPLGALPALLADASLCVCNGSGVSHLAAALGVPTVCILGGTTRMEVWHPAGAHAMSVGGRTPCQPCGLRYARECPWGVACLDVVQPAHVIAACETVLATSPADRARPAGAASHPAPSGSPAANPAAA